MLSEFKPPVRIGKNIRTAFIFVNDLSFVTLKSGNFIKCGYVRRNLIMSNYKFQEQENTVCCVCDHVMDRQRPILRVLHDIEDGMWQFLCGQEDHTSANIRLITMEQATKIDLSINDLFDMLEGFGAERASINERWIPFKTVDNNE
jgi:hypothetical protein